MSLGVRPPWQVRVRVRARPSGRVRGGGALCANGTVVTCAHVADPVGSVMTLDFPFLQRAEGLRALVVHRPEEPEVGGPDDVAVLRLDHVPQGAAAAPFTEADGFGPRRECGAYGFPAGHPDGVWALGRLVGPTGAGLTQFESADLVGHAAARGFSGSPLWHEGLRAVIGIVAAVDAGAGLRTGYAIPVAGLLEHWPELVEPHPVRLWVRDPYGAPPRIVPLLGGGRDRAAYWVGRNGGGADHADILLESRPPHVVSRWHCRLVGEFGQWFVESPVDGPRTFVRRVGHTGEERVPEQGKLRLRSGDRLLIPAVIRGQEGPGHWELEFVDDRRTLRNS